MSYKEIKPHGTYNFPLEIYSIIYGHPRYEMAVHWHIEDEIVRILEGELHVTLDQRKYIARTGDVVFISSGTLHSAVPKGTNCRYECLVFDMRYITSKSDICQSFIKEILNFSFIIKEHFHVDNSEFHNIIWEIFETMTKKTYAYELKVKGLLYQMISNVFKENLCQSQITPNIRKDKKISKLKDVLEMIHESYELEITLKTMSSKINMSPKYFCSFFKDMTNKTPMQYLINHRIEQACLKLENSELSVTEIAFSCGFNDLSHFIKTFKNIKKQTPKQYRVNI